MRVSGLSYWVPRVFWIIACVEFPLFLYLAAVPPAVEFGGAMASLCTVLAVVAGVVMLTFAFVRNRIVRAVLLALMVVPLVVSPVGIAFLLVGVPLLHYGVRAMEALVLRPATAAAAADPSTAGGAERADIEA